MAEKNGSGTGSIEQISVAVTGRIAALALKLCSAPYENCKKKSTGDTKCRQQNDYSGLCTGIRKIYVQVVIPVTITS